MNTFLHSFQLFRIHPFSYGILKFSSQWECGKKEIISDCMCLWTHNKHYKQTKTNTNNWIDVLNSWFECFSAFLTKNPRSYIQRDRNKLRPTFSYAININELLFNFLLRFFSSYYSYCDLLREPLAYFSSVTFLIFHNLRVHRFHFVSSFFISFFFLSCFFFPPITTADD